MAVPKRKQHSIERKKEAKELKTNTIEISISMVSSSADKTDINRIKGSSHEANTGYVDLSEYAALEERLREAAEAKTVKKLEEEASPPKEKKKAKKGEKKEDKDDEDKEEKDDDDESSDDGDGDDDSFAAGDDEDE